jgi:hypothetical protein
VGTLIGNVTISKPAHCYFCGSPAAIELGRRSYIVDCAVCAVQYEVDVTAWTAGPNNSAAVLEWVRQQRETGADRPVIDLKRALTDGPNDRPS